jgi:hypothetical protein
MSAAVIYGCSTGNPPKLNTPTTTVVTKLQLKPSRKSIDFYSIGAIDSIVYLDSLLPVGKIKKIQFSDSLFFILDSKTETSLLCFSITGKFKWQFNSHTKGWSRPSEFVDFHVSGNKVYLLDVEETRVLQISLEGRFEKKYPVKGRHSYPSGIFAEPDKRNILYEFDIADFKKSPYQLTAYDSTFRKVEGLYSLKTSNPPIMRWSYEMSPLQIFNTNRGFYYTKPMNDTIFSYSEGNFKANYAIDFGEHTLPDSIKKNPAYTLTDFFKSNYCGEIQQVFENDSIIFFRFQKGAILNYVFLSKKSNATKVYNSIMLNLNIMLLQVYITGMHNNKFVMKIDPINILQAYKAFQNQHPGKSENELGELLKKEAPVFYTLKNNLTIYSNPVLMMLSIPGSKIFTDNEIN